MTEGGVPEISADAGASERARLRQEQLFALPPRIAPLDRRAHAVRIVDATTKLSNAVSGKDGPPVPLELCPELVATFLHHPGLWDRLSLLSVQVQGIDARLPPRIRQLAIMRTVWLSGAPYQWGEHIAKTKRCGVSCEEIEQIKRGSGDPGWCAWTVL